MPYYLIDKDSKSLKEGVPMDDFSALQISANQITSGTLPLARGGTGQTTLDGLRNSLFGDAFKVVNYNYGLTTIPSHGKPVTIYDIHLNGYKPVAVIGIGGTLQGSSSPIPMFTIGVDVTDSYSGNQSMSYLSVRYWNNGTTDEKYSEVHISVLYIKRSYLTETNQ